MIRLAILMTCCAAFAAPASAQIRITEWQYNGEEYIEFSNVGTTPIDMTGWSFDDDSRIPGSVSLSGFGGVAPGASVILCEVPAATFATTWRLTGVAIVGSNTVNLGRNDEINIYDAGGNLVDRLTYGDQNIPGSIRTLDISGSPCHGALGQNDAIAWCLAYAGDSRGSIVSALGKIGNPGSYRAVNARLTTYGSGCAGTGNITPALSARGCPALGGQAIATVANGLPSGFGVLLFGAARAAMPIGPCTLNIDPLLVLVPVSLDVLGAQTITLGIPTDLFPGIITTQVILLDAGVAQSFSATVGLELDIQ